MDGHIRESKQYTYTVCKGASHSHFELNTKYIRYKFLKVVATRMK